MSSVTTTRARRLLITANAVPAQQSPLRREWNVLEGILIPIMEEDVSKERNVILLLEDIYNEHGRVGKS